MAESLRGLPHERQPALGRLPRCMLFRVISNDTCLGDFCDCMASAEVGLVVFSCSGGAVGSLEPPPDT